MSKENVAGRAGLSTTWTEQRMSPYTKRADEITWAPRKITDERVLLSHPADPANPKSSSLDDPSRTQMRAQEAIDALEAGTYDWIIDRAHRVNSHPDVKVEPEGSTPQIDF